MARGIRHVRTTEGEKFFGLPIGSPITEHLYLLKKAEHAGHIPKGLTTTKSSNVNAPNAGTPKAAHPSLKGTGTLKVGAGEFHAPAGSKVINVKDQPGMKFVRTPDGTIHAFNEKGEVDLPDNIQNALQKKFTPDFAGDAKYGVEDLNEPKTPDEAKPELSKLAVGTVLQDSEGNVAFTKQPDGDWKHEALGIDVSDKDIQDDYESGELSVQTKEESTKASAQASGHNFKDMTAAETKEVLDADPAGTKYVIDGGPTGSMTSLEKQKDGTWNADMDGTSVSGVNSQALSYLHDNLKDHKESADEPNIPDTGAVEKTEPPVEKPTAPETPKIEEPVKPEEPTVKTPETKKTPEEQKTENKKESSKELDESFKEHKNDHKVIHENKNAEPEEQKIPIALKDKVSGPASKEDIETLKPGESVYTSQGNKYTIGENGKILFTPAGFDEPSPSSFKHENLIAGYTPGAKGNVQGLWLPKKQEKELPKVEEPEANIKGFKQWDEIPKGNTEWYDYAPVGAEIQYQSSGVTYRKSDDGGWHEVYSDGSTGYSSWPGTSFDETIERPVISKISEAEEKAPENLDLGSEDNPSLPKVGEHVLDVETANKIPAGTALEYTKKDGTTSEYAKLENGNFLTPGGGQIAPEAMSYNFKNKKLTVKSYPNVGTPDKESLDPGHTQFTPGGQVYTDKDMQDALDALQGHSGFQISYGLKSVPENPIAKNADELKQAAVSAHPELKPKAAAVAFLKDKLGKSDESDLANLKDKLSDDSPKMSIRAGDEKHEFTSNQMQKAVDILNDYNGKLFKNELNKKGSPLGNVDWNKAVGFHKDKTEGKQAVVDLLNKKIEAAKQIEKASPESGGPEKDVPDWAQGLEQPKEELADWEKALLESSDLKVGDTIHGWDDLNALAVGSVIHNPTHPNPEETEWTKIPSGGWQPLDDDGNPGHIYAPGSFWGFQNTGYAKVKSIGDGHVEAPSTEEKLASALSTNNDLAIDPNAPLSKEEFEALSIGSVVHWHSPDNDNERTYTKVDALTWKADDSDILVDQDLFQGSINNQLLTLVSKPNDLPDYAQTPVAVLNKEPDVNSPDADIPSYNQSGLLPGKYSTKNGKAYMIVKSDGSGIYVNGNGDVQKLTPGKVKANHKAGMSSYLGVVPEDQIPNVPDGPKVISVKMTKKNSAPVDIPDGTYFSGTIKDPLANTYEIDGDKVTIKKADGTVTETTKNKLKTILANGKLLDENGNSVLGENHTGSMYMWNTPTTGESLVDAKTWLQEAVEGDNFSGIYSYYTQKELAKRGIILDTQKLNQQILKQYGGSWTDAEEALGTNSGKFYYAHGNSEIANNAWNTEALKLVQDQFDEFAQHINTSHPENGAAANFDWTVNGQAKMPLETASVLNTYSYYDTHSLTNAVNEVKKNFGDGKTIGQVTMSKWDKETWLSNFKDGNFKAMYDLEVQAAVAKGKVLPNGWKHPGYTANTETHNVTWGPAIEGEIPAGTDLGNGWSEGGPSSWSPEEIDNYLIKAQMQNPTYLSPSQKSLWASTHKTGHKKDTDALSLQAALDKKNGSPEVSTPPVWSDTVKPAKLYNKVFTSAQNPEHISGTDWGNYGNSASAKSWLKDNVNDPDFTSWVKSDDGQAWMAENVSDYYMNYSGQSDKTDPSTWEDTVYGPQLQNIIGQYFQQKYDAWHEEAIKPNIKHTDFIANGTHPVYVDEDVNPDSPTFGKKYVFKPAPKQYIVEQDVAANKLSKLWGYNPPTAEVVLSHPVDGEMGFQQEFASKTGDLTKGHDTSLLGETQLNDIAKEHVLDWMLDNDDSHGENFMIMGDGHLVGIDKSRAFKAYGQWQGLDPASMNTNADLVYSDLYKRIQNQQFTKEQADQMYLAAIKAAKRIQKSNDSNVSSILLDGVKNRTSWAKADYMSWDHHQEPVTNAQELIDAVLDRKAHLVENFDDMWKKLYDGNGWSLPEPPEKALGEDHLSGWDEADTIDKAIAGKTFGVSAIHSDGSIIGGHSLLWTEEGANGETLHFGQLKVGQLTSDDIVGALGNKVQGTNYMSPQSISNFPNTSDWKSSLTAAGKEATKNIESADPTWDSDIAEKLAKTEEDLKKDSEHWSSDLKPEADGYVHFPSGKLVPEDGLFQYKSALDHYSTLTASVEDAKGAITPTNKYDFTVFNPIAYAKNPKEFYNGDKWYKQLSDGNYLYYDGQTVRTVHDGEVPSGVKLSQDGWSSPSEIPNGDPNHYELNYATGNSGQGLTDGLLKNAGENSGGHHGHEYVITLPTGEKVKFRDHNATSTLTSQQGLVSFQLAGDDKSSSLSRVQEYLESLGVNLNGADEEGAELNYWRQMFGRVFNSIEGDAKINNARVQLEDKLQEAREKFGKPYLKAKDVSEALSKVMSPQEEAAFYRNLADETWGADKVSEFLADEGHLPQYSHLDIKNPEIGNGHAWYKRIDVDTDELEKSGHFIAVGNTGGDNSTLKYLQTGGNLSTEERLRMLGNFKTGVSSESDQGSGGGSSVFLRVAKDSAHSSGALVGKHRVYYNPALLSQVGTYAFSSDSYGNINQQVETYGGVNIDVLKYLAENKQSDNEVMVPGAASLLDFMEIMVFDSPEMRNEAIQQFKAAGIDILRGMPIEDRIVLEENVDAARKKVQDNWKNA